MSSKVTSVRQPRVKLVAIAKDESAYLPQWVHHHLYFGFDEIEIYINRTTDNSAEMLDKICHQNPGVKWDYADWVDMCPSDATKQIQFIVYAKALAESRARGDFTHIMFLDIDEFWCPQDFATSIQSFILDTSTDNPIYFEWINDLGDHSPFSPLPQVLAGNLSPLGKTLLPLNTDIIELRHHYPRLSHQIKTLLANGEVFVGREKPVQALEKSLNFLKSAFVFHRAHRSELEYVSLLYRGRPGNTFNYKNNRTGLPTKERNLVEVSFPHDAYSNLQLSFESFMQESKVDLLLPKAVDFVHERYQQSLQNMLPSIESNCDDMMKIFHGVTVPEVLQQFTTYRRNKIEQDPENVALIRDLAIQAAKHNLDEAIELMSMAEKLRPKGPQIKKKLAEFREKKRKLTTEKNG